MRTHVFEVTRLTTKRTLATLDNLIFLAFFVSQYFACRVFFRLLPFYAPYFGKVEGAYCFGLVRSSVLSKGPLMGTLKYQKFMQGNLSSANFVCPLLWKS